MKNFRIKKEDIKRLIDVSGECIATDKITVEGSKIGYMYREEPSNEYDTGWRFFAGDEDEEYTNNSENFEVYDLNTICNYDEDIISYLTKPIGTKLERDGEGFKEVE